MSFASFRDSLCDEEEAASGFLILIYVKEFETSRAREAKQLNVCGTAQPLLKNHKNKPKNEKNCLFVGSNLTSGQANCILWRAHGCSYLLIVLLDISCLMKVFARV